MSRNALLCAARTCTIAASIGEIVDGPIAWIDPRLVRSPSPNEIGVAATVCSSLVANCQVNPAINYNTPLVAVRMFGNGQFDFRFVKQDLP